MQIYVQYPLKSVANIDQEVDGFEFSGVSGIYYNLVWVG